MLTKNKNPRASYLGRILVLPLSLLIFAAFTLKTKTVYNGNQITVVLDAGHGGDDAGAQSTDGTIKEKDINLAIVKKIKELNTNDKINIILTRDNDIYQSPFDKVDFTKKQDPALFISFHIDSGPIDSANTKTGMSIFIPKDENSNAARSKTLASIIINTFSANYGLPVAQNPNQRQKGIWVLKGNTCPAVLIEAGFMNNKKDLDYLLTEKAKETIAKNIFFAIC